MQNKHHFQDQQSMVKKRLTAGIVITPAKYVSEAIIATVAVFGG
jgi:hypothetical protein